MKALCFGSLNIDYTYKVHHFVQKGETISSQGLQVFTGGKGLNQSVALAKAGAETYHAGAIGEDGLFLLEAMGEAGVHTEYVDIRQDVRTGNAIIQNDLQGDNCIILFGGANQAIRRDQVDRVLANFNAGDYLILQNEINEMNYIVEMAHRVGMTIVLNPSPMNEKILKLPLNLVDFFLLNEVEASQILETSCDRPGEELLQELSFKFPRATIVLTLGEAGSMCRSRGKIYQQEAFQVTAVDTTAAGDTFTGYFVQGMMSGQTIAESMERASMASAISVTRAGAAPSIPSAAEVCEALGK